MPWQALGVGVGDAVGHDVEPTLELVAAASSDHDPGWGRSLVVAVEGEAEHVLERLEPEAALSEQDAGGRFAEVGELDLDAGAAGGERRLDLVQVGHARHAGEADPGDLVERRARLGEAHHSAGERTHVTVGGGRAAAGHELCLGAFDPLGERGVAEQGHAVSLHVRDASVTGRAWS
jgi:hypothetical protein